MAEKVKKVTVEPGVEDRVASISLGSESRTGNRILEEKQIGKEKQEKVKERQIKIFEGKPQGQKTQQGAVLEEYWREGPGGAQDRESDQDGEPGGEEAKEHNEEHSGKHLSPLKEICTNYLSESGCPGEYLCGLSHPVAPDGSVTSRVCDYFLSQKGCAKGERCDFLHNPGTAKFGTAGMTGPKGQRLCDFHLTERGCNKGDTCLFWHPRAPSGDNTKRLCDFFQTRRGCSRDKCRFLHVSRKALGVKAQLAQTVMMPSSYRTKNGLLPAKFTRSRHSGEQYFTPAEALGTSQICAYFKSERGCIKGERCDFVHAHIIPDYVHPAYNPVMMVHPATGTMVPVISAGGVPIPMAPSAHVPLPLIPVNRPMVSQVSTAGAHPMHLPVPVVVPPGAPAGVAVLPDGLAIAGWPPMGAVLNFGADRGAMGGPATNMGNVMANMAPMGGMGGFRAGFGSSGGLKPSDLAHDQDTKM